MRIINLGIIVVRSFVGLLSYIFTVEGSDKCFFASGHLNQDPIENYFGQQRARGGRSDNPSVKQFMDNTMSLRQQGSAALLPVRGNSSRKRLLYPDDVIENDPIPKRRRGAQRKSDK